MSLPSSIAPPSTVSSFDDDAWEDLLNFVEEKRVIPIIGPELATVQTDSGPQNLYAWLARSLAARLNQPEATSGAPLSLNDVIVRHLANRNSRRGSRKNIHAHYDLGNSFYRLWLDDSMSYSSAWFEGDRTGSARTVVVNEGFARLFQSNTGQGSPIGARVRRRAGLPGPETAQEPWYEIVGVARDIGLDPSGDAYEEGAFVYFAASPATVGRLVTLIRVRGNSGGFAARLPVMAARRSANSARRASRFSAT